MKIRGHILSVETIGDSLKVVGQGECERDALWRSMEPFEIRITDIPVNQRAYYVGRTLEIEVTLK